MSILVSRSSVQVACDPSGLHCHMIHVDHLQAREAVQQLAEMARLGVQPDSMLGTALIDACARSGHMQMAQAAFEELFGACLPLHPTHRTPDASTRRHMTTLQAVKACV